MRSGDVGFVQSILRDFPWRALHGLCSLLPLNLHRPGPLKGSMFEATRLHYSAEDNAFPPSFGWPSEQGKLADGSTTVGANNNSRVFHLQGQGHRDTTPWLDRLLRGLA
jgi:hypothetical protein